MKSNLNPKHYNKKYFIDRDHLDLHQTESLKIFMLKNNLKKVLDVGCGSGRVVKYLNDNGFDAFGCDPQEEAVNLAKKLNKKNVITQTSAAQLPFKNQSFDLITAISVIEHLSLNDIKYFFTEAQRILRPEGFIFMITPNFSSPMRFFLGKKWFGYADPTHINFFTPASLTAALQKYGFGNIKLRHTTAYNIKTDMHLPVFLWKLPMPIKNILNYLLFTSPLSVYRDSFWISAQKKI